MEMVLMMIKVCARKIAKRRLSAANSFIKSKALEGVVTQFLIGRVLVHSMLHEVGAYTALA